MGEYYCWVNVDKKEYICPHDFDFGNKATEPSRRDNSFLMALQELLAEDWKGDRVAWLGDEIWMDDEVPIPEEAAPDLFATLRKQTEEAGDPGSIGDTLFSSYRNVSCLFQTAESCVRSEIGFYLEDLASGEGTGYNEYGIDPGDPYAGLFQKQGRSFRYTINRTKGIAYCLDTTRILYPDGNPCKADPLPFLLACGMTLPLGAWLGDVIDVADEIDASVRLLEEIVVRQ